MERDSSTADQYPTAELLSHLAANKVTEEKYREFVRRFEQLDAQQQTHTNFARTLAWRRTGTQRQERGSGKRQNGLSLSGRP